MINQRKRREKGTHLFSEDEVTTLAEHAANRAVEVGYGGGLEHPAARTDALDTLGESNGLTYRLDDDATIARGK